MKHFQFSERIHMKMWKWHVTNVTAALSFFSKFSLSSAESLHFFSCALEQLHFQWNKMDNKSFACSSYFVVSQSAKGNITVHVNIFISPGFHFIYVHLYVCMLRTKLAFKLKLQFLSSSDSSQRNVLTWIQSTEIPSKFGVDCNLI